MTKESELLVTHLSKEIEMANTLLLEQRTKNNLWVAFGPVLILGGLATSEGALKALRGASPILLGTIGIVAVVAYFGLGIIAARVEEQIWTRANMCRRLLASKTGLDPDHLVFSTKGLYFLYALIFSALGAVFVGLGCILYLVGER